MVQTKDFFPKKGLRQGDSLTPFFVSYCGRRLDSCVKDDNWEKLDW